LKLATIYLAANALCPLVMSRLRRADCIDLHQ
jgi:hypothetical protein